MHAYTCTCTVQVVITLITYRFQWRQLFVLFTTVQGGERGPELAISFHKELVHIRAVGLKTILNLMGTDFKMFCIFALVADWKFTSLNFPF